MGSELRLAHEEQRLGLTMSESLEHMAERICSRDLRYFVAAVAIQTEVEGIGGSYGELVPLSETGLI